MTPFFSITASRPNRYIPVVLKISAAPEEAPVYAAPHLTLGEGLA